ncbi:MAG: hypothetical protein H7096_04540 [Flavobacterium sp.]|nr:hypothetical protein [Pedobacter sp.]
MFYHFAQSTGGADNPYLTAVTYFDIYEKQSFLIEELAKPDKHFYWGEIYFSSFYKFIPRIIWEGKPYAYGFAILNYDFLPEFAALNYMPSFGLGSLYADFGFPGVIFFGMLSGFIRQYCYQIFIKSGKNSISALLYYWGLSILTIGYLIIQYILAALLIKLPKKA